MIRPTRHIRSLLLTAFVALSLTACTDMEGEREICDYKVLLRYDYNEENTSGGVNMIEYYIYTIDEYIFREDGILFAHRRITPDRCREMMNSEWDLPPGRYSVIAIGNQDERSLCFDLLKSKQPENGVTPRENMRLSLENAKSLPGGTKGDSERLYHGYRTFTVKQTGISRVRVDMINAHLRLKFRVTWKYSTPSKADTYYGQIESVPSEYKLMPEYIYPVGDPDIHKHNPAVHDDYPSSSNDVIHHIPYTVYQGNNTIKYRYDTYINADGQMFGYFTTYRIQRATRPILRIYNSAGKQIIKDIDLQGFFDWWGYESPTATLKQDYELNINVIDELGTAEITPLDIADWEEGGVLL